MSRAFTVLVVALSACTRAASPVRAPPPAADETDRWRASVEQAAAAYPSWGLVDDQGRWAPELCMLRVSPTRVSAAPATPTGHGQKLYFLSALDPVAYGAAPTSPLNPPSTPVEGFSQIVVKEAFAPVPTGAPLAVALHRPHSPVAPSVTAAQHDGHAVLPGEFLGLYVMLRTRADAPGTDHGWVYATVDADARTVLHAGRLEACMGCHASAPHDRLFGLQPIPR